MSESTHQPSEDHEPSPARRSATRRQGRPAWELPPWARRAAPTDRDGGRTAPTVDAGTSPARRRGGRLQAELMMGEVDDPAEREADRVADTVASTAVTGETGETDRTAPPAADVPAADQAPEVVVTEAAIAGAGAEEEPVQLAPALGRHRDAMADAWQERVQDGLAGSGRPLTEDERARMEQSTGVDLGGVRVHDDAKADLVARAIGARAFTVGDDVAFRAGEYDPRTPVGRRLLAHELTHVVQQRDTARSTAPASRRSAQGAAARPPAGAGGVVRRAIVPEDVAGELVGRKFELSAPFAVAGVTLAAGTTVTVVAWSNTSATAQVTAPGVSGRFAVPKTLLVPARTAVAGVHPYGAGVPAQARSVEKGETDLANWVAKAALYTKPLAKSLFDRERKRLEDLLEVRRKSLNRKLIQETMFNRFDATIGAEVAAANKAHGLSGKDALDPNLVKALFFQESELGTAGVHMEDPPTDNVKTRFNLGQVIDSSGLALLTLLEREHPAIVAARKIGKLRTDMAAAQKELAKLEAKGNPTATEAARLRVLKTLSGQSWENFIWAYAGFDDAVNDLFAGASPARNLDYTFWIHMAVLWIFEKRKAGMTWEQAVKAYNGSGARAEHYRQAVAGRAAGAAAAAKAGTPFTPTR
jgi:hypothetical protein